MTPDDPSDSAHATFPGRAVAAMICLCSALGTTLALAPARLAARGDGDLADRRALVEDLHGAYGAYWRSGAEEYPPDLARIVDYWARYSLLRAVILAALLIALVALGRLLWRASSRGRLSGPAKRLAVVSAGTTAWGCALATLWMLTAGIQGAAAPFGALLPLLREGTPGDDLSATFEQARQQLDGGAPQPPVLAEITDAYAQFHVVHAIAAAPTTLFFLVAAVVWWRRASPAGGDARGTTLRSVAALCAALLGLAFGVVCAANVATAANPEPGLLGFFEGGR